MPDRPGLPVARFPASAPDVGDGRRPPARGRSDGRPRDAVPSPPRTWTTPTSGVLGVPFAFCPACGASLEGPEAFVQELWVSEESVFHVWCPSCGFVGNVIPVHRMIGHEAEG